MATVSPAGSTPAAASTASSVERVPEPASRSTQGEAAKSRGVNAAAVAKAWSGVVSTTSSSAPTTSSCSAGSSMAPSAKPSSATPARTASATSRVLPTFISTRTAGCRAWKATRRAGSQWLAMVRLAWMARRPRRRAAMSSSAASAAAARCSTARASARKTRPVSFSTTPRPTRSNR